MPPAPPDPGPGLRLSRRRLLQLGLALPLPLALAACDDGPPGSPAGPTTAAGPATTTAAGAAGTLAPTPACDDGDDPTLAQTEGPYFTPNSPERASLLEAGLGGRRLVVAGTVLTTDCRPVRRALLDFWQADDAGQYDNQGYRLRGHQFSDAEGGWRLETVVPGLYTGRTRHIHVKVQAPDGPVLTTQLYFPGEPANDRDGIFRPELLLADVRDRGDTRQGSFTFVLET
jgi:protocatechuate 3,4-dioxygenase beta subunit